jgi:Xaa-Pro aminopeptidase
MRRLCVSILAAALLCPAAAAAQSPRAQPSSVGADVPADLPADVYRKRRDRLISRLGPCAAALRSPAGGQREGGPDPYFFYLTGVSEPGALLLLSPRQINKHILFLAPLDPDAEKWSGHREALSPALQSKLGMDEVRRTGRREGYYLARALRQSRCYAHLRPAFAQDQAFDAAELGKYLSALSARTEQRWEALENMRAVKEPEEVARMEKAIAITLVGHRAAVQHLSAGTSERLVASRIEDAFFAAGGTSVAFPSIVASGPNGAILHWNNRDRALQQGDLVVVDIGASYGGYAADITRTYPVSGRFTAEQRAVYDAVLAAQEKVIAAVKPGISLAQLHQIGEKAINQAGYELPHSIGHFVGLEVHDVGDPDAPLEAGMVITVEPGIYLQDKFGVRIEDMVLVTARGHRLLSGELPRKAADIETLVQSQSR